MKAEKMIKNMEFLLKELHKEWERSGIPVSSELINMEDAQQLIDDIQFYVVMKQKMLDESDQKFRKMIAETKETYVCLRIARKITEEYNKIVNDKTKKDFCILLDKDEKKLYKMLKAS